MTASWVLDSTRVVRSGARAGAAVIVLGLSLAAPQAMGVARADGGSGDGSAASAGPRTDTQQAGGGVQSSATRAPRDVATGRSGSGSRSGEGRGPAEPVTLGPASAVADTGRIPADAGPARRTRGITAPVADLGAAMLVDAVVTGATRNDAPHRAVPRPAAGVRPSAAAADAPEAAETAARRAATRAAPGRSGSGSLETWIRRNVETWPALPGHGG